jgi:hypothetical protein
MSTSVLIASLMSFLFGWIAPRIRSQPGQACLANQSPSEKA